MRRRLLNLLTAMSLLLCVASVVFGIYGFREGRREPHLSLPFGRHHALGFLTDRGALAAIYSSGWPAPDWVNERPVGQVAQPMPLATRNALVVEFTQERWTLTDGMTNATVTYWGVRTNFLYAAVFTAVLPALWLLWRVNRTYNPALCATCAYDLRATPDCCPECGTPATTPA